MMEQLRRLLELRRYQIKSILDFKLHLNSIPYKKYFDQVDILTGKIIQKLINIMPDIDTKEKPDLYKDCYLLLSENIQYVASKLGGYRKCKGVCEISTVQFTWPVDFVRNSEDKISTLLQKDDDRYYDLKQAISILSSESGYAFPVSLSSLATSYSKTASFSTSNPDPASSA